MPKRSKDGFQSNRERVKGRDGLTILVDNR